MLIWKWIWQQKIKTVNHKWNSMTVTVTTGLIQPEPNCGVAGLDFSTFCFVFGAMVQPGEDEWNLNSMVKLTDDFDCEKLLMRRRSCSWQFQCPGWRVCWHCWTLADTDWQWTWQMSWLDHMSIMPHNSSSKMACVSHLSVSRHWHWAKLTVLI